MRPLTNGTKGSDVKKLQTAINARLRARGAANLQVEVDGEFGQKTRDGLRWASYLLGLYLPKVHALRTGRIDAAEQSFVLNPGRRNERQKAAGKKRVAAHRVAVAKAAKAAKAGSAKRKRIVALAEEAAAHYRLNPGAYHYLAGGFANTEFLKPTPRTWRSDCSQFVASVYKAAGVDSPAAPLDHQWASTFSIVKSPHARFITQAQRKPGDLGMYGTRTAPHHVELWCGDKFIGHGSPPIDSLTPGEPDYYVTFDFLK